jgi:lipid A 3-O-deacylase
LRLVARAGFVLLVSAVAPHGATAQSLLATRVRADNDAFNFWQAPWYRPDEEYTSGVRGQLDYGGQAWWGRWLHGAAEPCRSGSERCASRSYAFGQDIYTSARQVGDGGTRAGSRPNAGWLYLEEASRVATQTSLVESSVMVGVTGDIALAQFVQRVAHGYAAAYNRPIDWSSQLPAEPGIILRYERTQRLWAAGNDRAFGADVEPHAGGSLGTILTEATAGARARVGFGMGHPWMVPSGGPHAATEVSVFADATLHGVIRNEFLAGTFFRPSAHVEQRPWVPEYQAGLTLRWRRLTATYRADVTGSEYTTRSTAHTWSSVELKWRMEP